MTDVHTKCKYRLYTYMYASHPLNSEIYTPHLTPYTRAKAQIRIRMK